MDLFITVTALQQRDFLVISLVYLFPCSWTLNFYNLFRKETNKSINVRKETIESLQIEGVRKVSVSLF